MPEHRRPSVSVCTPTYQGVHRLQMVAPRLLAALGADDEWIISVDGSTDGTVDFLQSLCLADSRVRTVVATKNGDRTTALNAACRSALKDIVLRLNDDILVDEDYIERHAEAHADAVSPIGVVHPVADAPGDGPPATTMWQRFVTRNTALDEERLGGGFEDMPPRAWGAVCSVRRYVGSSLDWYDRRFAAYGWEDVDFGYRLHAAGIPIVRCSGEGPLHMPHVADFCGKFERGLEAGQRMAVFATIHGPEAVLVALGREPRDYAIPRGVRLDGRRPRASAATQAALARLAFFGEGGLSKARVRRGYDWWVARWLSWAYARGWDAEVRRHSLPRLPSPLSWRPVGRPSWVECWAEIVATMSGASSRPEDQAALRALARSVFLRTLEREAKPASRRWREAAGALLGAARCSMESTPATPPLRGGADVLVILDAATPSNLGRGLSAIAAATAEGLRSHVICSMPGVAAKARTGAPDCGVSCVAEWRPPCARVGRLRALTASLAAARRVTRSYARTVRLPLSAHVQLTAEGVQALSRRRACQAAMSSLHPRAVVSPSEYFDVGVAMIEAAHKAGVPFVTMQHGAVNRLFLPSFADRYLVWSRSARDALVALDPALEPRIVVAEERPRDAAVAEHGPQTTAALRQALGASPSEHLVGVFSQTHGAEFSAATHFTLAAQLDHLLAEQSDVVLAIKRHPSERRSAYESLLTGRHSSRVTVAPFGLDASAFAAACDVVCALPSSALRDAMAVGCPAIEVECDDSLVQQPLAVLRRPATALATNLAEILFDEDFRLALLDQQDAALLKDRRTDVTLAAALRAFCEMVPDA